MSYPLEFNGLVTGVFSIHLTTPDGLSRLRETDLKSISIAVAAFLQYGSGPLRAMSRKASAAVTDPSRLTERQTKILRLMSVEST